MNAEDNSLNAQSHIYALDWPDWFVYFINLNCSYQVAVTTWSASKSNTMMNTEAQKQYNKDGQLEKEDLTKMSWPVFS